MDENNIISYGDLQIAGFEDLEIVYLSINHKVNEHTTMNLLLKIKNGDAAGYQDKIVQDNSIVILRNGKPAYFWLLGEHELVQVDNVNYINIKCVSLTYSMDIYPKSRSFKHTADMTYKDIQNIITDKEEYPKVSFADFVSNGRIIEQPIIQFWETDWALLKRMAKQLNSFIVTSIRAEGPAYYLGIPNVDPVELKVSNYSEIRDYDAYKRISIKMPGITPPECTIRQTELPDIYELGQKTMFNGVECYLGESVFTYQESYIRNLCRYFHEKGLSALDAFDKCMRVRENYTR